MTKSMKILILIVAHISIFSSTAFAKNPWTQCGLGSMIFPTTKWASATSNTSWDLGLTGSSSTTSSEEDCRGADASMGKFIIKNYAQVEEETAKGHGRHLTAMLNIINCNTASHQEILKSIRNKHSIQKTNSPKNYFDIVIDVTQNSFRDQCVLI